MRPDPMQILCNLDFFEQKLKEAGVENAHQKMVALHRMIIDWKSINGWTDIYARELRAAEQSYLRWPSKHCTPAEDRQRTFKQAGRRRKTLLLFRQELNRLRRKIDRKVDAWLAITYTTAELKSAYDGKKNKSRLKKRASRNRGFQR